MGTSAGERFVAALAAKDRQALLELLDPGIEFRGLTPGRAWEANSAEGLVDEVLLGQWFEEQDRITEVVSVDSEAVGARWRVGYTLGVSCLDGPYIAAQQAFYGLTDGRISWLRIMCAGFQPVGAVPEGD